MDQQESVGINIASSGAGQKSSSEHQSSTEIATNTSSAHQQQHESFSLSNNVDVRMKRHPELQPYMPCDRFVPTTTPARSTTAKNSFGGSSNLAALGCANGGGGGPIASSSGHNNRPKKYVSMTRLNQLAQPKRRQLQQQPPQQATSTVPPSSLTSSNATSTTASSLASSKNFSCSSGRSSNSTTAKQQQQQHLQPKPPAQPRRLSSNSLKANNKPTTSNSTTNSKTRDSTSSAKSSRPSLTGKNAAVAQQQKLAQAASKTPQSRASTSIRRVSRQSFKESTPLRHDLTFDSGNKPETEAPISPIRTNSAASGELTPKVEIEEETTTIARRLSVASQDDSLGSQKIAQQTESPSQKQQMSVNINRSSSSNYLNDNSSNFASVRQPNDDGSTSLAEQLSEMSMNDRHFQSAASELLVPEHLQTSEITNSNTNPMHTSQINNQSQSSTTNNGTVNLSDRNPDSLIRELQEDALAKGLALYSDDDAASTPRVSLADNHKSLNDDLLLEQHESTATMWRPQKAMNNDYHNQNNLDTPGAVEHSNGTTTDANNLMKQQDDERIRREREEEEEERRLKIEEEIREMARREEKEREERGKLVNSIMSRFSQGSP